MQKNVVKKKQKMFLNAINIKQGMFLDAIKIKRRAFVAMVSLVTLVSFNTVFSFLRTIENQTNSTLQGVISYAGGPICPATPFEIAPNGPPFKKDSLGCLVDSINISVNGTVVTTWTAPKASAKQVAKAAFTGATMGVFASEADVAAASAAFQANETCSPHCVNTWNGKWIQTCQEVCVQKGTPNPAVIPPLGPPPPADPTSGNRTWTVSGPTGDPTIIESYNFIMTKQK